jgi:uncharacterized protein (TIGR00290 family)
MENFQSGRLALSWSGGKDSALALWTLRREHGLWPRTLITTVTDAYASVSMHGVRRELVVSQARSIGVDLVEITIPVGATDDLYEQRMADGFASDGLRDVKTVAFGDLFLEDIRAYRESRMEAAGLRTMFPLWQRDTSRLAREFIAAGFQAILVCIDPAQLDPSFAGRAFDADLLDDLPAGVDPCGENGEFHTFVHAGPILTEPIACRVGEIVERDGFVFSDVLPVP